MERKKEVFLPKEKFYSAFTLAEVLITLGIIGVVAAIVIPVVMYKNHDQEMVKALKKNYSIFAEAYSQSIIDNGESSGWDVGAGGDSASAAKMLKYFSPYLKIVGLPAVALLVIIIR